MMGCKITCFGDSEKMETDYKPKKASRYMESTFSGSTSGCVDEVIDLTHFSIPGKVRKHFSHFSIILNHFLLLDYRMWRLWNRTIS